MSEEGLLMVIWSSVSFVVAPLESVSVTPTDEEVVTRSGAAVFQARLTILGLQDVHDVRLLAEDLHHGLGDRLAQSLVLRERDVDGIILLVPSAALNHAFQLGDGTEQTRVHAIAV